MSEYVIHPDIERFDAETGTSRFNAVFTVCLGELIESGVFGWDKPEYDWSAYAYSAEQYARFCEYFDMRFYYREVSMVPLKKWQYYLMSKIKFELCPKYNALYERVAQGYAPLASGDEYRKKREIRSEYPETLLSANADYISDGNDLEEEIVREGDLTETANRYAAEFRSVDKMMADELESMFMQMYTANVNGL